MNFEEYWNNYGELHASFCGGNLKQFAKEFWLSAQDNKEQELKGEIMSWLWDMIGKLSDTRTLEEFFQDVIDYVESTGTEPYPDFYYEAKKHLETFKEMKSHLERNK